MKADDFIVPWARLVKLILLCLFLPALFPLLKGMLAGSGLESTNLVVPGGALSPPARHLPGSRLVFLPRLSPGERTILQSQLEPNNNVHAVELRPTWPEYLGIILAGLFVVVSVQVGYALAARDLAGLRTVFVSAQSLIALEAALFTYAVGALLGWYWLSPWPFLAMGAVCRYYSVVRAWLGPD